MSLDYTWYNLMAKLDVVCAGAQARAYVSICISCMNAFLMPGKSFSFSRENSISMPFRHAEKAE